jgi:hypothetical protein
VLEVVRAPEREITRQWLVAGEKRSTVGWKLRRRPGDNAKQHPMVEIVLTLVIVQIHVK